MPLERNIAGLTVLKNAHPAIRRLKRNTSETSLHGNKYWNSCQLLIDFLHRHPPPRNIEVIEVGCGWGIGGIYCARNFDSRVTALDADAAVFPYLELHAEINQVSVELLHRRYEQLRTARLAGFQMLIGSDICFWENLSAPLFNLVRRARRAGVKRIVLADPGRDPFFEMAENCCSRLSAELQPWQLTDAGTSGWILTVQTRP